MQGRSAYARCGETIHQLTATKLFPSIKLVGLMYVLPHFFCESKLNELSCTANSPCRKRIAMERYTMDVRREICDVNYRVV